MIIFSLSPFFLFSQKEVREFNTDSLLKLLSSNTLVKSTLHDATIIYEKARINSENLSLNAFKIAYLQKCLLDSNLVKVQNKWRLWYTKKDILTVIDFTKTADKRRFCTIDIINHKVLFDTLVSHGSAKGLNEIEHIPKYFGNIHNSNRSSLGLIVTREGTQPNNPGHFCKYILTNPHDCSMFLSGLEATINDQIRARAIVMHTTGSKNYSDSLFQGQLKLISKNYKFDSTYFLDEKKLKCYSRFSKNGTPCYATERYIRNANNFIGRSLGCLVLPEENHIEIIKIIKNGSLIFAYSNIITSDGTNYFEESPIIKQILAFVNK